MLTCFLIMALAQSAAAEEVTPAEEPDLPEVVVVGRIPRCRAMPGDPLDSVDLAAAAARSQQQVIKRDPVTGAMGVFPDDDPVTGPGVWQRAGTRMDQFVFRVPQDGKPLCIGARSTDSPGWGQLRQVVDATPYHGKTVRVTMWAACGSGVPAAAKKRRKTNPRQRAGPTWPRRAAASSFAGRAAGRPSA